MNEIGIFLQAMIDVLIMAVLLTIFLGGSLLAAALAGAVWITIFVRRRRAARRYE